MPGNKKVPSKIEQNVSDRRRAKGDFFSIPLHWRRQKFVEKMSRDFLRQRTAAMNPEVARNLVLSEIEAKLQSEGKSLDDFKLPQVDEELILEFRSPLLNAELNYDIPALQREVDQAERTLNVDQRAAFNAVYESIFE